MVMPAFNAAGTLERTCREAAASGVVDEIIVVDDASDDETIAVARGLAKVKVFLHDRNRGYGATQKTCYRLALEAGADIVVMIHPDYQYTPRLLPAMVFLVASGLSACVLGSRLVAGQVLRGGMAWCSYRSTDANNGLLESFQPNNLSELTTVCGGVKLAVAGVMSSAATGATVNGSAANLYNDNTFALGGFSLANGWNTFTAVAQDSFGRGSTNAVTLCLPTPVSHTYDANGNLTGNSQWQYIYDEENQLVELTAGSAWKVDFVYDGLLWRRWPNRLNQNPGNPVKKACRKPTTPSNHPQMARKARHLKAVSTLTKQIECRNRKARKANCRQLVVRYAAVFGMLILGTACGEHRPMGVQERPIGVPAGYSGESGDMTAFFVGEVRRYGGHVKAMTAAPTLRMTWWFKEDQNGFQVLFDRTNRIGFEHFLEQTFGNAISSDTYPHLLYRVRDIGVGIVCNFGTNGPLQVICLKAGTF